MRRVWLQALVLCAFLARVALPALHLHEEAEAHGEECHGHHHEARHGSPGGPAVATEKPACPICEILAAKVPGLAPEPPPDVSSAGPAVARAHAARTAQRSAEFSLVGAPRGPPLPSSPA
jgi:hypothetical protein